MAAPTPSPLPPIGARLKTVETAVNALLKWRAAKSKTQKPQLLEQDEFVYLILTLKKIPQKDSSRVNPFKVPLPHPLLDPRNDNSEICLIIDDRPKSGLTKEAAMKKLENDGVPVSKIVKLSKLKTDYRPFEAKRKLCDSYDMFFADKRVIPLLPKMLGKHFFKKKKIPVGVDLRHKNWKEQIEKACGSGLLFLRSGTCSVVKVGRVSMGREAIVENVVAAINGIVEVVPRKWGGVRSFHLKLLESLALPLYQAVPDLKLKIQGARAEEEEEEEEEEAVKEESSKKKKKGRIHEVRYMDNDANAGESFDDEDELGNVGEGDVDDDAPTDTPKFDGKKRKKTDEVKGMEREKKVKRVGSIKQKQVNVKSEDGVKLKKQKRSSLVLKRGEMDVKEKKKKIKKLAAE